MGRVELVGGQGLDGRGPLDPQIGGPFLSCAAERATYGIGPRRRASRDPALNWLGPSYGSALIAWWPYATQCPPMDHQSPKRRHVWVNTSGGHVYPGRLIAWRRDDESSGWEAYVIALIASIGLFSAWAVGSPGLVVLFGVILGIGITFGALELRTRWLDGGGGRGKPLSL